MLADSRIIASIPATDLDRAHKFYEQTLGLSTVMEVPGGLVFGAGGDTAITVYQRGPTKADHTAAVFQVEDVEAEVKALAAKGVRFEQYNMEPGPRTNSLGIAEDPSGGKVAWFKDTEGNILGIVQTR